MIRSFLVCLFSFMLAIAAVAQSPVPDRREIVTRDVDFYGSDLTALFDTSLDACRRACMTDADCHAYTFNSRSNACFPKSAVSRKVPFEGAVSAELTPTDPAVLADAAARRSRLDFLGDEDITRAREQAEAIGARHPAGGWSTRIMLDTARSRAEAGDHLNAMRWTGAAVSVTDRSELWTDYARHALRVDTENASARRHHDARALQAATNAYLRAASAPAGATALSVMADALERAGRGRDMIAALRLAQSTAPRQETAKKLDRAVARYGFRVTGHDVETEVAQPRLCAEFSEPLIRAGTDYTPYVRLRESGLVVQVDERQICIDGVRHGERYQVTFREGLPAASGETLAKDIEITAYVRDRAPKVSFPGRAYVLPAAAGATLPVETVNTGELDLTLRRVSDRNLLRTIQEDFFARPLSRHDARLFNGEIAENVWQGSAEVGNELNRTMTTRLPMGDVLADEPPGIYALTARVADGAGQEKGGATQWFVLSDLGLTTMKGSDGLHVFVRGLSHARAREDVNLTLVSRANRELASATTDARGHAMFEAGLARGTGGAAPALVMARSGEDDLSFLSLTDPAFDLSDRGVAGRPAPPPVDVFLATDRGAYRAGEVIHATALARDAKAAAIPGLPLTAILTRPDGVEYARHLSARDKAGGHVFAMPVDADAPRGTWTIEIRADVDAPPLATQRVLVEDFLPERLDAELALPDGPIRPGDAPALQVTARYLFGAPGAGLDVEGRARIEPRRRLDELPGYVFGRHDAQATARTRYFDRGTTGEDGKLTLPVALPEAPTADRPYEARLAVQVSEGSGRPVERRMTRMLAPSGPMIGIRPEADGVVPEGSEAGFLITAVDTDLAPMPMRVEWTLNRVETRYQWYQQYGRWNWEPITTRKRVTSGTADLAEKPVRIAAQVDWGRYELVVERADGPYVAASTGFDAGWHAPADTTRTPDTLEMSLDKPRYRSGDTATLRLVPRHAGMALVTVLSNHVIDMKAVRVDEGENTIPLQVTDDWGSGAYVTAQVIRPMDVAAGRNPARALGLSHAKISPGDKQLGVTIDAPEAADPRGPLDVAVKVAGVRAGEAAHVTLAAVDLGILNLTGHESPDPSAHYFGQRRLGVEISDLYGRLIDGMSGAEGRVRSGGDAGSMQMQSPPPTEDLVAFFSGPLTVDGTGRATARFDLPDFNGTVRLMAVAWSPRAVGQAARDVLVRDPVVMTASLPRFMAPGDETRLLLELVHMAGPAGRMGLDVTAEGLTLGGNVPSGIDLEQGEKLAISIPVTAQGAGDHTLRVALTTPDGNRLTKRLTLPVRRNDPEIATTRRFSLGPGDTFTLNADVFAGLRTGTGRALVSAGPLAKLNAPALLSALDRYPYGCTEQVASKAMPLLYFDHVAEAIGLGTTQDNDARIDHALRRVLTRQASNGAFGLWRAQPGDFWLDAYVSDFLSRARTAGHTVPDTAFAMAMDNLRNRVNYAPDFDTGGEDIAYALLVLAREGAARMGDLRYYADVKAENLATPLAAAQLGAALAAYGDQTRADRMFAQAVQMLQDDPGTDRPLWRSDYGTPTRDRAGVLALALEAGSDVVDDAQLADSLTRPGPHMSTQERVWTLLAAKALIDESSLDRLTLNGSALSGPFARMLLAETLSPREIRNTGDRAVDITLTTTGVPEVPADAGGYGYGIERSYYDMDGEKVDLASVAAGTRLVAVLTITPFEKAEARLMIDDPVPAGLEIDNPNLLRAGDIGALDWLDPVAARHSEFRADRFLAAVDWRSDAPFRLAYIARAVTPGSYHHPAATVEDMYRPRYRANTGTGRMTVTP